MRIVIDGRPIKKGKTGVGVFTENLVRAILTIDRKNKYFLIVSEEPSDLNAENLHIINLKFLNLRFVQRAWENTHLPFLLFKLQADVYFSPSFMLPLFTRNALSPYPQKVRAFFRKLKLITTVPDVIAFLYPEKFTFLMRRRLSLFLPRSMVVADKIITISMASKRDIIRLFNVPEEKIHVVYLGKDSRYSSTGDTAEQERVRKKFNLPEQYILNVGTIEPRKNLPLLFRAYTRLPGNLRQQYKLVIAGGKGWYYNEIFQLVRDLQLQSHVLLTGYVPDEDIAPLYQMASIFVFPSLYEGFGLPVLEAMACGVPVIASNTSSLPEIIGDAGLLINPNDELNLTLLLQTFLTDPYKRQEYVQRSLNQAEKFSWQRAAEHVLSILSSV